MYTHTHTLQAQVCFTWDRIECNNKTGKIISIWGGSNLDRVKGNVKINTATMIFNTLETLNHALSLMS